MALDPSSEALDLPSCDDTRGHPLDDRSARLSAAIDQYALVWRNLRRLGVPEDHVDDAIQEVFLALAKRLEEIAPGKETGFLVVACTFVAKRVRRRLARRVEVDDEALADRVDA